MRPNVHCQLINGPFGDPVLYAEIMFEQRALLFDMGDIRALPARKLMRVSHAFVSHAHMDHFADFDRLLRLLLGRDKTVSLYGPTDFIDRVEHKLHGYTWNVVRRYAGNLVLNVYEAHSDGTLHHARFESLRGFRRQLMPEVRLQGDVPGVIRRIEGALCYSGSWHSFARLRAGGARSCQHLEDQAR